MYPDKVTIYTINPDQDKYQTLQDFYDFIQQGLGLEDQIWEIRDPWRC